MRTSDSISTIAPALVKALGAIQHATKNADNPHFRSRYADLTEVIDTAKPILLDHGITVIQAPGWDGEAVTLTTRFLHESGEWMESIAGTPVSKADPQGVGSAITYLRRYSLAAMCAMGQEDDDGNTASETRSPSTGQRHARPKATATEEDAVACPMCEGAMWDNREDKRNPKAPDLKCKDKECGTAIWLDGLSDEVKGLTERAALAGVIEPDEAGQIMRVAVEPKHPAKLLRAKAALEEKMLHHQGAA